MLMGNTFSWNSNRECLKFSEGDNVVLVLDYPREVLNMIFEITSILPRSPYSS